MHPVTAADNLRVRGVVFDMDGTLVAQTIDFDAIRRELGLPFGTPLLEAMDRLPDADRVAAWAVLDRHEQAAVAAAEVLPGVLDFLNWLDVRGVKRAVLTRNSRSVAEAVLGRCGLSTFDPIVTRDDAPFKPQPEGLWRICKAWGVAPSEVLMLGDYVYDIQVGRNAGARTALLTHGREWPFAAEAEFAFATFTEGMSLLATILGPEGAQQDSPRQRPG
jgi:HAD superfamily hydrolase (TIGR01549 family)